jgi:hypothetical protein
MRAIRAHCISAGKADTGDWQIDPVELHRVFPLAPTAAERHDTPVQTKIDALREVSEKLLLGRPQPLCRIARGFPEQDQNRHVGLTARPLIFSRKWRRREHRWLSDGPLSSPRLEASSSCASGWF